jgi:hypothetical protein
MRDAFPITGKKITFNDKVWTIKEFYYVPNNPNIYVALFDGSVTMNVLLESIKNLIVLID